MQVLGLSCAWFRQRIPGTVYLIPTNTFCGQAADVCVIAKMIIKKGIIDYGTLVNKIRF